VAWTSAFGSAEPCRRSISIRALIEEVTQSIRTGDPKQVEMLPRFGDSDPLIERLMLGVRDALHDDSPSAAPYVDYLGRAIGLALSASTPQPRQSIMRLSGWVTVTSGGRSISWRPI
jgi:hypothetical protein